MNRDQILSYCRKLSWFHSKSRRFSRKYGFDALVDLVTFTVNSNEIYGSKNPEELAESYEKRIVYSPKLYAMYKIDEDKSEKEHGSILSIILMAVIIAIVKKIIEKLIEPKEWM